MQNLIKALPVCMTMLVMAGYSQNPVSGQYLFVMISKVHEVSFGRSVDADAHEQYKVYESETEHRQDKPLVIKLIATRTWDTYAQLMQHLPLGNAEENYLRPINGSYPQDEPTLGQYVMIVE